MAEHPSDSELVDMGDEEYRLAETIRTPLPEPKLPYPVARAFLADPEESPKPPARGRFQFSIRDMLVATTVIAFLLGLAVSIQRGMSVSLVYLIIALVVAGAWFGIGLWEAGYWHKKRKSGEETSPSEDFDITPVIRSAGQPLQYSVVDLFLMISIFAFLMSLCTFLPGQNKLINAAGFSGICTLLGLLWLAFNDPQNPLFLMAWWMMLLTYLITSLVIVARG